MEEKISYRIAARNCGLDKMTLIGYIKKKQANENCIVGYNSLSLVRQIF